ncbi:hypothetical protein DFH06DRAFT_1154240 [Mycena polygramma]|nr:hypothetical protein DFH06DRAFT_1154240 [Mycena polygramma]
MAFRNLGDCVAHFEAAELSNIGILTDNRARPGACAAQFSGYKQTYNTCIWGQASNHLLLQPTLGKGQNKQKYTLEQKFAPYCSSIVQEMWCVFLGDLKTWADALHFILNLNILNIIGRNTSLAPGLTCNKLKKGPGKGRCISYDRHKVDSANQAKETQGDNWIQGANSTDHLAFPIPLSTNTASIQAVINSCMLSMIFCCFLELVPPVVYMPQELPHLYIVFLCFSCEAKDGVIGRHPFNCGPQGCQVVLENEVKGLDKQD